MIITTVDYSLNLAMPTTNDLEKAVESASRVSTEGAILEDVPIKALFNGILPFLFRRFVRKDMKG